MIERRELTSQEQITILREILRSKGHREDHLLLTPFGVSRPADCFLSTDWCPHEKKRPLYCIRCAELIPIENFTDACSAPINGSLAERLEQDLKLASIEERGI